MLTLRDNSRSENAMLQVAFLCLFVGQVPPPPAPQPPEPNPTNQREWLLDHLLADLQAQGKLNAQKQQEVEKMVNDATDSQIDHAVHFYQQQFAQAQADLRRLIAYRDSLKREVERRKQVYQQEQAIMIYGSALAAQQAQWAMGSFYAAQAWPYYYVPCPHHHRHW